LKLDGTVFRWLLVVILVLLAWHYVDWPQVASTLNRSHLLAILLVQPIQFAIVFLLATRFVLLTGGDKQGIYFYFEAYLLSIGLNSFVPGKLSELIKVSYLREKADLPAAASLAGIFLEKITDIFFLGLIALIGISAIWTDANINFVLLGMGFSILMLALLPRFEILLISILKKLPGKKYHKVFQDTVKAAAIKVRSGAYLYCVGLSLLIWAASYIMIFVVLKFLHGPDIDLVSALLIFVAMAVGRAIPGLPAAIGTFEAAIVLVMHQLGFGLSEAFATALTIHASQLVIITLVSLLVLGKNGTGLRSMIHRLKDLNAQN